MKRYSGLLTVLTLLACTLPAAAQYGPATSAGVNAGSAAAQRRVMMQALQHGGNHGGCYPLPGGWSSVHVTVRFPDSYGGYGAWVNNAELVPVGAPISAFLRNHKTGPFQQTAYGNDSQVQTTLCGPAGYRYWVVVDSGTSKVLVGRIVLRRPNRNYHAELTAPPLGSSTGSTNTGTTGGYQPPTTQGWKRPTSGGWAPPSTGPGLKQPTVGPGFQPPATAAPAATSTPCNC